MTNWKYEGQTQDDGEYQDHDFSDGNLCKRHVLTFRKEDQSWGGTIFTSQTPDGGFDADSPMPAEMVQELRSLIGRA